jgi:GWxTD domain-containing protein
MKIRILLTAALMAITASAFALSSEYTEWAQGPAQFLMTKEEVAQWKAIKTDDEAKAFVELFWARRDPTPATARNEYRERFDAAVEYADKNLGFGKRKGSMTDRGKTLILYGQPKKVERSAPKTTQPGTFDDSSTGADVSQWTQWVYEGDEAREIFGIQRALLRFTDRMGTGDFKAERGSIDLPTAQQRAIAKSITQPNLTVAPAAAPAPAAAAVAAPAPVPASPMIQTQLTTASLTAAVDEFKAAKTNPYAKSVYASWGEYVTPGGEYFVPVLLYVSKSAGLPASGLTFFGVVQDESGNNVLAFEQPATLSASKDDFFVDKSLFLPAGKHRGIFGLAENGKPVAMVSSDMTLAGSLDKDAWAVSPLILSNNVFPMTESQAPTDPFSFGGVKVVPKADQTFHASDELWYFFELRNPGLAEAPPPADGTVPVTAAAGTPKIQLKIDVEGTETAGKKRKFTQPLREVSAPEMKGVPGHYGVGEAIPLASFAPGDYTFTIKVLDTVKKTSHTISEKFKVIP